MEQKMNDRNRVLRQAALAGALALAGAGFAGTAWAGLPPGYVKCYGIAKAHQNQCRSIGGITRGSATTNGNPDAWLGMPKGVCTKIVGGSLTPGK
jgi:uncharacterized membrane protein